VANIFVSYTSKDRDWAFWIAQELEALGHAPHVYEWEIPAGGDIAAWMEKRLDDADHVLCVVSQTYLSKDYSTWERQSGQWDAVSSRSNFVLPVFVEECKPPRLFAPLKRCELYGVDQDEARSRLAEYLKPAGKPKEAWRFPGAKPAAGPQVDRGQSVSFPGDRERQPRNLPFPSLGSLFAGRNKDLESLRAALVADKSAAVAGRALHGLGGIGKTRLAIEYAWRHADEYSALLFVRADDRATLDAGLAALAGLLDLPEKEAREDAGKIAAVLRWLEDHPTWLLILDNVDDAKAVAAVRKLMAKLSGGHLIVTARAANFPATLPTLELEVLDESAAAAFLMERTRGIRTQAADDATQALAIARETGGLALALEQAGGFIAHERIGFARYLKLLDEQRAKVLDWARPELTGYPASVGATWAASVEKLTPESRRLLERLAMLAPEPIPYTLLDVAVPGEAEGYDAYEARSSLFAYLLATGAKAEGGAATGFVVHPLVQSFARRAMSDPRRAEALREALAWVNDAFRGDPQDVRTWPILDPLTPHALVVARRADEAGIAEPTARLLSQLASLSYANSRYADAEPLYRRALAIDEARREPDHPEVATDLNNLASLLRTTNRLAEAEPLYRRALAILEKSLGPDHPSVASNLNNLAGLFQATNRLAEAEPLYRRALAIVETSLGPDHPQVATGLNNLAGLLETTNRLAEAEPPYRRALAIDQASYGPDHPTVATDLNNLAGLLQATNRLGEAEPLYRRALTIDETSLGPDHPTVGIRLNNLAELLKDTNRLDEARPLYRRALAINEASLGRDHPRTLTARENLAALEAALGRDARTRKAKKGFFATLFGDRRVK
jgi:tetratricopeptide (TPR) repeat protein